MTTNGIRSTPAGRHLAGRLNQEQAYCPTCRARLVYGEPDPDINWSLRFAGTPEQIRFLASAAAEFDALSSEHGEPIKALGFVDWLGLCSRTPEFYEADGVKVRSGDGAPTTPDPLPYYSLPRRIGRRATS